jgi:hypothetical protein
MREKENEMMARLFEQMTDKDRKWFLSLATETVRENPVKLPILKLVVGGNRPT